MLKSYHDGELDIVVGMCPMSDAKCLRPAELQWIGNPDLLQEDVLPIAMLEPPCMFRKYALESLAEANRSYRIIFEAPNISALKIAVDNGLAITCRSTLLWREARTIDPPRLPALPQIGCFVVHNDCSRITRYLAALIEDALLNRPADTAAIETFQPMPHSLIAR